MVKNHTPPRPFGRDHHLGKSASAKMQPTVKPKCTGITGCNICWRLGKPPDVYNHHSISKCPFFTKHRALLQCSKEEQVIILKDAMNAVLEKQEEDILQGPVNPSS